MELYILGGRNLWGDYGDVLVSGYCSHEKTGPLLLHRAGPFLPMISFPWYSRGGYRMIVSDEFKQQLINNGYTELEFKEAVKHRIIPLDWHEWDVTKMNPKVYPHSGEPEDYIWDKPHDQRTADRMPSAWEVLAPIVEVKHEFEDIETADQIHKPLRAVLDEDFVYPRWFCTGAEHGSMVVDQLTCDLLRSLAGEWLDVARLRYRFA